MEATDMVPVFWLVAGLAVGNYVQWRAHKRVDSRSIDVDTVLSLLRARRDDLTGITGDAKKYAQYVAAELTALEQKLETFRGQATAGGWEYLLALHEELGVLGASLSAQGLVNRAQRELSHLFTRLQNVVDEIMETSSAHI